MPAWGVNSAAMKRHFLLPLALGFSVAACGSLPEGDFPSLAKRPYEDSDPMAIEKKAPVPAPSSLPASLAAKLSALERRARAADAEFRTLLPAARAKASAAKGAAQSSDRWIAAQIALSRLDRSRADAVAALSEVDVLLLGNLDEGLTGNKPQYAPLMEPAQQRIAAIVKAQNAIIDGIFASIG